MSGGRPSRPQTAEGDHPSCTNEVRKDGETGGCARSASERLGLDGGWGRRPLFEKGKRFSPSGLASDIAQGMKAAWPRPPKAGSVYESPAHRGAHKLK